MMHKHHLVPKHRGGTDNDGLVEVSVTCHAMFHYCEWRLHGHWQDRVAWKMLAQTQTHPREGVELTDETKDKISQSQKERLAEQGTWNKGVSGYKTQPASEERRLKVGKGCVIMGIHYPTQSHAARALNISPALVSFRCRTDLPNWVDWRQE